MKSKNIFQAVLVAAVLIISGCAMDADVNFARRVFAGLAKGRQSTAGLVEWQLLKALDQDVGATYSGLTTDADRFNYPKAFIEQFSKGFKRADGRIGQYANWRVYEIHSDNVVVATDYIKFKGNTLLFTISKKNGARKLIGISWAPMPDENVGITKEEGK